MSSLQAVIAQYETDCASCTNQFAVCLDGNLGNSVLDPLDDLCM